MAWSSSQLLDLLPSVIDLALQAGDRILDVYDTSFDVIQKPDNSPLTQADMAAHGVIATGLTELTPDLPQLSEEGRLIDYDQRCQWTSYWLIDPLDGTREFVKRNGEFSVNIALIEKHESVLGVVYAPVLKRLYFASRGNGAFIKRAEHNPEPIAVNGTTGAQITVAGSRSHTNNRLGRYLDRLGDHTLINMGSSLKACLVAEGKADLYPRLGPTSEWDTGAAQCIVEEAGGMVTSTDMQPLRYNTKESILNPHFFVFGDRSRNWSEFL